MKSTFEIFNINLADQILDKIPKISYSIRCTNQGWGIEIAELVRNCIIGFVKTNDVPLAGFRRKAMEYPSLILFPSVVPSVLLLFVFSEKFLNTKLKSCKSLSAQVVQFLGDNIPLTKKVDFLVNFFNTCEVNVSEKMSISYIFFISLSVFFILIIGMLLPVFIFSLIQLPDYRFILFTEASKKEQEKYFTRISRISWWRNFWLITVGVSSILAFLNRILWNYISEWWGNIFG